MKIKPEEIHVLEETDDSLVFNEDPKGEWHVVIVASTKEKADGIKRQIIFNQRKAHDFDEHVRDGDIGPMMDDKSDCCGADLVDGTYHFGAGTAVCTQCHKRSSYHSMEATA